MIGRIKSNRAGECSECGGPWRKGDLIYYIERDWGHWFDSEACAQHFLGRTERPVNAQTPPQPHNMPPTANIAVNEATERSRAIHEAHQENMKANERLVQAIDLQTAVCDDLRAELAKIAKELLDARMERHGVKLP